MVSILSGPGLGTGSRDKIQFMRRRKGGRGGDNRGRTGDNRGITGDKRGRREITEVEREIIDVEGR